MQRTTQNDSARSKNSRPPATDTPVPEQQTREHKQELLDEGLEESFPASDPPSIVRD